MVASVPDDAISACSSLAAQAYSGAREIESSLSGRFDAEEFQQLRSLASKLQRLGADAANLERRVREAQAVAPELVRTLSTEVAQYNDSAAAIIKQLMRLGTDTPREVINAATVLLYESATEAATRFVEFVTQILASESIDGQEVHLQSHDATLILDASASARRDISRSSGILLETGPVSQNHAETEGGMYGAKLPGYAVHEGPPPGFEESSGFARAGSALPSAYASGSGEGGSSKHKGSDGGFFSSLGSSFKAATAALRSKPEPLVSALCEAAAAGNVPQIRSLLAEGANIDGRNEDGQTALVCAVRAGRLDSIQALVEAGADPSRTNSGRQGRPPLFHAIDMQSRPAAELLLKHGADPNQRDEWAQYYFHALIRGDTAPEWIALLLAHGADASAKDASGQAPVILAIRRHKREEHREELVRMLVQHGASVDTRDTDGTHLVHICLQQKRRGLALELLALGADPNAKDVSGIRLLEVAVKNNDLGLAKVLLENGADPNAKDFYGSHLLFAVLNDGKLSSADRDALAALLLEHGARGGERDFYGVTALEHAVSPFLTRGINSAPSSSPAGDKLKIVELLLKRGADPNQRLTKVPGEPSVLSYAVEHGLRDLAALVLQYRAAVNAVDKRGRTPLALAVERGEVGAVAMLLQHGANVSQPGPELPLDVAVRTGSTELVNLLKGKGAVGK